MGMRVTVHVLHRLDRCDHAPGVLPAPAGVFTRQILSYRHSDLSTRHAGGHRVNRTLDPYRVGVVLSH